jgi:hypothetical protein
LQGVRGNAKWDQRRVGLSVFRPTMMRPTSGLSGVERFSFSLSFRGVLGNKAAISLQHGIV